MVLAGRYRLDNVIGTGGMGTVWRGYDEMLHRPVAVKELHLPPQLGDTARAEAVARAMSEARYAARLQHPGIVAVYDIVEHDGRPWIVMQLVEGVSLFRHVQQHGPMPPVEAARIGLAMLDALSAAHAAGVVHRDVKPSNVLLGSRGEVLLTDFSIAFALGSVTMTSTGVVLGSPGYVAPERISGGRTGPEADLFGLGATLFFLAEGVGPFDAEDPLAGLLASATQLHPRPRNTGPLTPVIDGLLVKDPAQRMTAQAAAEALRAIVNGAPVAPWPVTPGRVRGAAPPPTGALRSLPGPASAAGLPATSGPPMAARPGSPRRGQALPRPAVPSRPDGSDGSARRRWYLAATVAGAVVGLLVIGGVLLALRPKSEAEGAQQLGAQTRPVTSSLVASPTASPTPTPEPTESPTPTPDITAAGGQPPAAAGDGGGGGRGGRPTTRAPAQTTAADDGVDDPPVIESVTVPSTVCVGDRFPLTVVAHDDTPGAKPAYEYTVSYPDGFGDRYGGELKGGPTTWTAEVGEPYSGTGFTWAGSTITGYVLFYDQVNLPPTTMNFPVTVTVVTCP